ncbi:hypothetical protein [Clostridium sp.]
MMETFRISIVFIIDITLALISLRIEYVFSKKFKRIKTKETAALD